MIISNINDSTSGNNSPKNLYNFPLFQEQNISPNCFNNINNINNRYKL